MIFSHWASVALVLLAVWILVSGLDDLFLIAVFLLHRLLRKQVAWPSESDLERTPRGRVAIFVPLWREQDVIGEMLEHNIASNSYGSYDFFIGLYPNDEATLAAVEAVKRRHSHIHLALCPHTGPTSKADCLNWIFQRMMLYEEEQRVRFDVVVTHDAEDIIHPESLRLINYFSQFHDMVQVPVLPLRTSGRELTHGLYCDEFAEFQTKDVPVRQILGGFIPSNGVGTGYSRSVLEQLAATHANRVFEPACLTEDYENGFRIHALKCPQVFLPIRQFSGRPVATREYFPRTSAAAIRQRTRWTMGISLQSWERHGWQAPAGQIYWFWRDRKGLIGNLLTPLANLLFLYGAFCWLSGMPASAIWPLGLGHNPEVAGLFLCTFGVALCHLAVRGWCVGRIYGWLFALGVPVRALWGNWINCAATVLAISRYLAAKFRGQPLVWLKTDHIYPSRTTLLAMEATATHVAAAYSESKAVIG